MVAHAARDRFGAAAHADFAVDDRHRRRGRIVLAADPVRHAEHRHDRAFGERHAHRQGIEPRRDPAALRFEKASAVSGGSPGGRTRSNRRVAASMRSSSRRARGLTRSATGAPSPRPSARCCASASERRGTAPAPRDNARVIAALRDDPAALLSGKRSLRSTKRNSSAASISHSASQRAAERRTNSR